MWSFRERREVVAFIPPAPAGQCIPVPQALVTRTLVAGLRAKRHVAARGSGFEALAAAAAVPPAAGAPAPVGTAPEVAIVNRGAVDPSPSKRARRQSLVGDIR